MINGLIQATPAGTATGKLAVLPLGSDNDFAHTAGCPRDLDRAARAIKDDHVRQIDVGFAIIRGGEQTITRYFGNNMGIGFEARVTLESYEVERLRGLALYLAAAIRALRGYGSPHVNVVCENRDGSRWTRSGPTLMITIGNSPRAGGGFYLTPEALMDDGYLDVGVIRALPTWRVVSLLPQILLRRHAKDPAVSMRRTSRIEVDCPAGLPVQLDGEVLARTARRVEVTVERRRLHVITER